jgi:peptidyl-prolyl cis-trans isomerase D
LGIGSEPLAATVNGAEITERSLDAQFQRFRQQLRSQLGSAYRPEFFDDKEMRKNVLDQMISDELLQQASHEMGLRVGNAMVQAAILGMPAFQKEGHFDQQTYQTSLRMQGLTPSGFEDRVRRAIVSEQLAQAVEAGVFVTNYEFAESERLQKQTRELSYFIIPAADYLHNSTVSDEEIKDYYANNKRDFISPEKVKLEYIQLDAATAGATLTVNDELLRDYYDNNQDQFGIPEQRKASHILIKVASDAEQAEVDEALAKLNKLAERISQGEDFAELAKQYSEDPGTAPKGGDLGFFGKGLMDNPALDAAVFALKKGEVSEAVRSSFGYHLIKLTGIKEANVKPFDEAKADVEKAYRKAEGEKLYFEMAEQLANLSYEDPKSLEPAANALGLTIEQSDWVSRDQATGVFATPKVLGALFSEDVLKERNNSELIEIDGTSSIVLRVTDHQESSVQPLEKVQDQVKETLAKQKAEQQAEAEAQKRMAEISTDSPLTQVAGSFAVTGPLTINRNNRELPPALSTALFRTEKPQADGITPGVARLAQGDYAVFVLLSVTEGKSEEGEAKQQQMDQLRRVYSRSYYERVLADLKSRADIEILLK